MSTTLLPDSLAQLSLKSQTQPDTAAEQSEIPNLQLRVTQLAGSITNETSRIVVGKVLTDLVFLLDYLSLVETDPRESVRIVERLSIVHAVREEAMSVVAFIEQHAVQIRGVNNLLDETLDSVAYAIKHEIKRVFDNDLVDARFDQEDHAVHGSLLHAQGILTNCFEQCMINLVRVFDGSLNGAKLFHNWKIRRERALALMRDLESLAKLVQDGALYPPEYIVIQLRGFKEGSMRWLMYRDWQEYEFLSEQVIALLESGKGASHLMHRFSCYLQTLLAHVKTRAVLAELEGAPFGVLEELASSWDL